MHGLYFSVNTKRPSQRAMCGISTTKMVHPGKNILHYNTRTQFEREPETYRMNADEHTRLSPVLSEFPSKEIIIAVFAVVIVVVIVAIIIIIPVVLIPVVLRFVHRLFLVLFLLFLHRRGRRIFFCRL